MDNLFTEEELIIIKKAKEIYPEYNGKNKCRKDLTGKIFGELKVLYRYKKNYRSNTQWVCLCKCGNVEVIRRSFLVNGEKKVCKNLIHRSWYNIIGKKFGRYNVLECVGQNKFGNRIYKCICDCQLKLPEEERKYNVVSYACLTSGSSKSCGCLHNEQSVINGKKNKKYNRYDLESEEYGIGYTLKGEVFIFDKEDYELIKDICWRLDSNKYVCSNIYLYTDDNGKIHRKYIKMHKLLQEKYFEDKVNEIDHINGNEWDNRKSNLRLANRSINCINRGDFKNNTSGRKGVKFNKINNKWTADIMINKKRIFLGNFDKYEDAVKAREDAEIKYFNGLYMRNDNEIKEDI